MMDKENTYRKAIDIVNPVTTRSLLIQKCFLLELYKDLVIIGVVSPPLQRVIEGKISNIEKAFNIVCNRQMRVVLTYVGTDRDSAIDNPCLKSFNALNN